MRVPASWPFRCPVLGRPGPGKPNILLSVQLVILATFRPKVTARSVSYASTNAILSKSPPQLSSAQLDFLGRHNLPVRRTTPAVDFVWRFLSPSRDQTEAIGVVSCADLLAKTERRRFFSVFVSSLLLSFVAIPIPAGTVRTGGSNITACPNIQPQTLFSASRPTVVSHGADLHDHPLHGP